MDAGRLRDAVARLLRANWREGAHAKWHGVRLHRPDPVKYPDQFFWDSCLHAVAWSHIDPSRARRELRTLVAAQRPDGLIGHTVFWRGRVRLARAFTYNLIRALRPLDGHDPAAAAGLGLGRGRRPLARRPGLPRRGPARRCAATTRGSTASGPTATACSGILQPDESGLDATPAYDAPLGLAGPPLPGLPPAAAVQPPPPLLVPAGRRRRRLPRDRPAGQHRLGPGLGGHGAPRRAGRRGAGRACHGGARRAAVGPGESDLPPARPGRAAADGRDLGGAGARSPSRGCPRRWRGAWPRSSCSTRAGSGCPSRCRA